MTAAALPLGWARAAVIAAARRRQRRRRLLLTAAVALAAVGAGTYLTLSPGATRTVTRFHLTAPVAVAVAGRSVWVVQETSDSRAVLVRLDPATGRRAAMFPIGRAGPDFGAAVSAGGAVWATAGDHVVRVDAAGRVARLSLPGEGSVIALGFGSVWVGSIGQEGDTISRLDARTLAAQARIPIAIQPVALRAGLGSLWLSSSEGLWRIDVKTEHLVPASVIAPLPIGLAVSGWRLWIVERTHDVLGVDARGRVRARIPLPFAPGEIAAAGSRLWIADDCGCREGSLALVDATTRRLVSVQTIGETPVALATDRSGVWVATFGDGDVSHVRSG